MCAFSGKQSLLSLTAEFACSQQLDEKDEEDNQEDSNQQYSADSSQDSEEKAQDKGEKGEAGSEDSCYEFNLTETTILEVVMDSMRTCGLALALQALSTLMLGMR